MAHKDEKDGKTSDEKIIERAKKRFKLSTDTFGDARKQAIEDVRFSRLGEQWPDDIKAKRKLEKRPCLTINKMPAFIRQVVNDARLAKPAIKVQPVDSRADPDTAEVMSGLIRNIEYCSDSAVAYGTALDSAVTGGFGFWRVSLDYATDDAFDLDLLIERIPNPLSVHMDHASTSHDGSDWTYCFVIEKMQHDDFEDAYPDAEKIDWEKDSDEDWCTEDEVTVAEYWTREDEKATLVKLTDGTILYQDQYEANVDTFALQDPPITVAEERPTIRSVVTQRVINTKEVLETNTWPGRWIPIVPVYGDEINEEGKRHFESLTRQGKDAQRNFNYWRTASTELVALAPKAPFIGAKGQFVSDAEKWATANTEPHAYLEYDIVGGAPPPQRQMFAGPPAGALAEAANASDDMKATFGIHDASLGARSNETSGVAIKARKLEGDVSNFHYIDNLNRAIRFTGRLLIDLIPKVYSKPRVMRVMGLDGTAESVQVNEEFQLESGITKMHDLTTGKYDLTVKAGPSFTTQREEAFAQMTDMIRAYPALAPLIGDLVAANSDWPGADEIAKRLKVMLPQEIQSMEKMEGLPPEAQAAIARAGKQVKELMQVLEQGKKMLQESQGKVQALEMQKNSKDQELMVKADENKKRFEADMAKVQASLQIAESKETEANRRLIITEAIDALKQRVEALSTVQAKPFENMEGTMSAMNDSGAALQAVSASMCEAAACLSGAAGKSKTIEITAPSGHIYTGKVTEE